MRPILAAARNFHRCGTYDASTTWQAPQDTVASPIQADRPGMAVVAKLPGGTYFMTYEDCGPAACTVYYRTSTDGWNWGSASNMGTKLQTPSGQYFEHAPTNTWSPSVLSSNGAILVIGQVFFESNGAVSSQNGEVILENLSSDGNSGIWIPITAPVRVPNAFDNYCPNYSSQLLPATDGKSLLELASAYNSSGICGGYYASETWNNLPADASTHAFINMGSNGLCIDDDGWGTANNTEADLWTCTGSIIQQWTVHSKGSGFFSLANAQTGLCLDNTGGSQTPQNPTTLLGCANNSNQNWQFIGTGGNAVYELMNQSSGTLVLDDWQASTTPGTQLEVFTANGSPAQRYILQDFATPAGPTGYIYCSAEKLHLPVFQYLPRWPMEPISFFRLWDLYEQCLMQQRHFLTRSSSRCCKGLLLPAKQRKPVFGARRLYLLRERKPDVFIRCGRSCGVRREWSIQLPDLHRRSTLQHCYIRRSRFWCR